MSSGILLTVVALLWITALVMWRGSARAADRAGAVTLTLHFHRGLTRAQVEAVLTGLTGLRPPRWRRWWDVPLVAFEVHANGGEISHRIVVTERHHQRVEDVLRAHAPGIHFEAGAAIAVPVSVAAEYRLTNSHTPLRVDDGLSRQLLTTLSGIDASGQVVVQFMVTPGPPPVLPRLAPDTTAWTSRLLGRPAGSVSTQAALSAAKQKVATPLLLTSLRIGATAPAVGTAVSLLRRIESTLHPSSAPGVHLRRRRLPQSIAARRLARRTAPWVEWPVPLNVTEMSGLLGWPFNVENVAGLTLAGCRPLPLSPAVPTTGTVLGEGTTAGRTRSAALDLDGRGHHLSMVGGTGSGKTTAMISMAIQDAEAGRAVLILDPKADLVDGFLARLDARHHERVVELNPSDFDRPVGIDPLDRAAGNPDLAVEHVVSTFHRIYASSWGVRLDDTLRAGLRTLVLDTEATLAELPALFTDARLRDRFLGRITDPTLLQFWAWWASLSDTESATVVAPLLNRLRAVLGRTGLRRMFCQSGNDFNLADHLNHGGIVVVPLNGGLIGEDAAALFAAVVLSQVWTLIQARAAVPPDQRHPTMLFIDELSRFVSSPVPLDELFAQARSYRVGVTAGVQHLGQLGPELRRTFLATPRSRMAFQTHGEDATALARSFGSGVTVDHLAGLDPYQVIAQLYAAGRTQPAATILTSPPEPTITDPAVVRELSRQRWGSDGAEVDARLADRLQVSSKVSGDVPTGRKRRSS